MGRALAWGFGILAALMAVAAFFEAAIWFPVMMVFAGLAISFWVEEDEDGRQ